MNLHTNLDLTDNDIYSGVICERSIDVPDIPLSYNLTGAKKTVTPKAFIQPAINKIIKFCHFNVLKSFFNIIPPEFQFLIYCLDYII